MTWQSHPASRQVVMVEDFKIVAYGEGGQTIEIDALAPRGMLEKFVDMLDDAGWTVRFYQRQYHDLIADK